MSYNGIIVYKGISCVDTITSVLDRSFTIQIVEQAVAVSTLYML